MSSNNNSKFEELYNYREALTDEVIYHKEKILDLDHRFKLNEEALGLLKKQRSSGDTNKRWVYTGDIFIMMKDEQCNRTLLSENKEIEKELKRQDIYLKKKEVELVKVTKDADIERDKFFKDYIQQEQQQTR